MAEFSNWPLEVTVSLAEPACNENNIFGWWLHVTQETAIWAFAIFNRPVAFITTWSYMQPKRICYLGSLPHGYQYLQHKRGLLLLIGSLTSYMFHCLVQVWVQPEQTSWVQPGISSRTACWLWTRAKSSPGTFEKGDSPPVGVAEVSACCAQSEFII